MVKYTYDAWGKLLSTAGSLASTLGTVQPFRYRGYVYDVETGFYYLRSRYYHPNWQRFLNADFIQTSNVFCYCECSPVINSDEEGLLSNGAVHQAVCIDIDRRYPDLHYTGNKISDIVGKNYGLADIRSDDGQVWEVKRTTVCIASALNQLSGYITGKWANGNIKTSGEQPKRGDFRPICGVLNTSEYIAFYLNIGNGFILYDYFEKKKKMPVVAYDAQEEVENLKDKVQKKATAFNPSYSGIPKVSPGQALVMSGCLLVTCIILSSMLRERMGVR